MCGINGIITFAKDLSKDFEEEQVSKVRLMNDTIVHRGPDSEGLLARASVVFGFRRLSIIDLDESANQPMQSSDKDVILVFNGEVYNYKEIREELVQNGVEFKTSSDTEVVLQSYLYYGDSCVQRFNGMWAFAIYDFRNNRLFCSRDRLGVKPFYYMQNNNRLIFSSELKAIHKAENITKANTTKVFQYLAYGYRVNDSDTFFEDCFELLPGTNMVVENGKVKLEKYWTLSGSSKNGVGGRDYHKEFTELFSSAVKLRYRSDVPVALLLSGGLDSSAIAAVTDDLIENGELDRTDVNAFTASFPNFVDDEMDIAREFVATCKHIKLHEVQVDAKNVIAGLKQLAYDFDHPLFSFNTVVHNLIMKECKKRGVKVVINGQGSDEAFAGYDRYVSGVHLLDQLVSTEGSFFSEFNALSRKNGYSKSFLLMQMFKSVISPPSASHLRAKYQEKLLSCLDSSFVSQNSKEYRFDYRFSLKGGNLKSYLLDKINNQGLNTILHYEDVSSMNQSVEVRSPFMDYRLMEFAFSIPNDLKFKGGVTKKIIRDTIGPRLPKSITENRRKIGFSTPFNEYLSKDEEFKSFVTDLLNSEEFCSRKIWKQDKIRAAFSNPEKNPNFPFWRVINLELWCQAYGISNL